MTTKQIEAGASSQYWLEQLERSKKREKTWLKQARDVVQIYRDEREIKDQKDRRINILWSNTEILKAGLFNQVGDPDVRRTFPKPGLPDKVASIVSLILERVLTTCNNRYDLAGQIEGAVEDMLLPGRGQCWLDLTIDPETEYKDAEICYVYWEHFRHGESKRWDDVPWVGRRFLFLKEDLIEKFPEVDPSTIQFTYKSDLDITGKKANDEEANRAAVWEIWDKPTKTRIYVAEDCPTILQSDDDPYHLEDFFPCPKPLYGIITTTSLVPKPEYGQYEDQAATLNRINSRLYKLIELVKYCGLYDGSAPQAEVLGNLGQLEDGQFIPYGGASALAEKGGFANVFMVRDLTAITTAIANLRTERDSITQQIFELTGISDIIRGASDPNETLGAQQIKSRYGSQRFATKQRAVQNFVRDLMKMKAELVAEHFGREQLQEMSGIYLPEAGARQAARDLLARGAMAQQAQQQAQQLMQQAPQAIGQLPPQAQQQASNLIQQNQPMVQNLIQQAKAKMQDPLAGIDPDKIKELQNIANAQTWEEVSAVLQSTDRRNYEINVETDITAFESTNQDKSERAEFLKNIQDFFAQSFSALQVAPQIGPLLKELLLFGIRPFKIARTLEDEINKSFDELLKGGLKNPHTNDPTVIMEEQRLQGQIAVAQVKAAQEKAKGELEMQLKMIDLQMQQQKAQTEMTSDQTDNALKAMEAKVKLMDLQLKQLEAYNRATAAPNAQIQQGEVPLVTG